MSSMPGVLNCQETVSKMFPWGDVEVRYACIYLSWFGQDCNLPVQLCTLVESIHCLLFWKFKMLVMIRLAGGGGSSKVFGEVALELIPRRVGLCVLEHHVSIMRVTWHHFRYLLEAMVKYHFSPAMWQQAQRRWLCCLPSGRLGLPI